MTKRPVAFAGLLCDAIEFSIMPAPHVQGCARNRASGRLVRDSPPDCNLGFHPRFPHLWDRSGICDLSLLVGVDMEPIRMTRRFFRLAPLLKH